MLQSKATQWRSRLISVFALLALASYSACCSAKKLFEDTYDAQIRTAAELYLPGWDWRWWKAQLYQESLLNPAAVSYVGAAGLCQAMPRTFAEWKLHFQWDENAHPTVPSYCITGGAWYMNRLRSQWTAKRSEDDRRRLAQASYNAGFGNIVKAQKLCNYDPTWAGISPCLVRVTGKHHKETITYIQRIEMWFWELQ